MTKLVQLDPRDPRASSLVELSNQHALSLYPPEVCYLDSADDMVANNSCLLGIEDGDQLVTIGAAKIMEGYGELKAVYTLPEHRGKGHARQIMLALERYLKDKGVWLVRLETGTLMPEAVRLYEKLGYVLTGPFNGYTNNGYSIFMEKSL